MLSSVTRATLKVPGGAPMHVDPTRDDHHPQVDRGGGTVLLPGVHDALAACVVQKVGFKAGFVSGFGVSASHLGKPDFGLLTTAEMTEVARRVCSASPKVAYIVDVDTGGGGPLNVQRVVKDLIKAGASGIFLEDQLWPKKCGHMQGKQVVPAEEHAAKIAAARDAIGDADLFLVARTDARSVNGLKDVIARANMYYEAGADGLFVEAPANDEELKQIGQEVKGFKIANMIEGGKTPLHTPAKFSKMGFSLVKHPLTSVFTTARALLDIMNILKSKGTTREDLDKLATFPQFSEPMDLENWYKLESRLNSFTPEAKEVVSIM
ncbi:LOW QUALITY PROTEIN: hypothetical protein Cgig2_003750 [Carnegiea gigantea]|uniref:Uncharacterized protein n=1 Tax=Carnegiea gigantea TaxID=171969 RepID=A0A9Q1K8I2_9CARY|nr:LOW QUALITY PROTEIN: hypothetical protein Cgig2_003750 [Carnegiea gigantea]